MKKISVPAPTLLVRGLAAGGLVALCLPALAQTTAPADAPADPPAAEARNARLDTVTVTATRRAERLQDVPLSVSAATAGQIEKAGINSIEDVSKVVSGVTVGKSPQDSGFRVRGVGTLGGFTSASEMPVGVVIDGVVMGLGPTLESMADVERLEALKGPQGTQFGKNASSGVVSITTRRPRLGKFEGDVSATLGSLGERQVQGTLNLPISDTVAARVTGFDRSVDGYLDNITRNETWGGSKASGARGKLLIKPDRDLDILLSADVTRIQNAGPGQMWTLRRAPAFGYTTPTGITPGADNTSTAENARSFEKFGAQGASAEINYRLGEHTLTSVTAHRSRDTACRFGLDQTASPTFEAACAKDYQQDSQEFRLTSPRGKVEYVTGVYFSRLRSHTQDSAWLNVAPGTFLNLTNGINDTLTESRSTALFGDGKLRLDDSFSVLAGLRATRDAVTATNTADTSQTLADLGSPAGFMIPATARAAQTGENGATKPSGRLGFEWKLAKDTLVYATMARGYLGPTVTFSGTNGTRTDVKAQTVDDVTIGFKTQMLDRTVTVNGSVFHDRYKNLQVGVFNGVEFLTENAGSMTSKGFELDTSARLSGGFTARGSLTYADARYGDYVTKCPDTGDAARCYTLPGGTTSLYQAAGQPISGAPKLTGVLGLDYSRDLDNGYTLDGSLNASFRSKTNYGAGETDHVQSGYAIVNAAVKLSAEGDKWHVGLWARNLFNRSYQTAVIGLPFAAPGGLVNWTTRDAQRTIGVTVGAKF
jgi:iron complex outermembrane receptor protein